MTGTQVEIHTDGACRGNPGPGGWGAVLASGSHQKEIRGAEPLTTNNRMELTAAIRALASLRRSCKVALYTDSQYLRKGVLEWLEQWKRRDWRTANRKPVKNVDLWQALESELARHEIDWHWVRGHSGNPGNERADRLANLAIDEMLAGG
jgi:ribonuclease HI